MVAVALPTVETAVLPAPVTLSVVVCVSPGRGPDDVERAVEALSVQSRLPDQVVVVVDHDDDLLERVADGLAAAEFRVPEGVALDVVANTLGRGASGTRNTGLEWATGDVVAFLDEDTRVADRFWVATLMEGFDDDAVAGVGGGASPEWNDTRPPPWFPPEFGWVAGCTRPGLPVDPTHVEALPAPNVSFRREVLDEIGGFADREGIDYSRRVLRRFPQARLLFDPDLDVVRAVSAAQWDVGRFARACWSAGSTEPAASRRKGATKSASRAAFRALGLGLRGRSDGFGRAGAAIVGLVAFGAGSLAGRLARFGRR